MDRRRKFKGGAMCAALVTAAAQVGFAEFKKPGEPLNVPELLTTATCENRRRSGLALSGLLPARRMHHFARICGDGLVRLRFHA